MKKIIIHLLFFVNLILFPSCTSDEIPEDAKIIGTWQLVEMYSDPGDGNGSFRPVDSDKTITFKTDKSFESNGIMCHLSTGSNAPSSGTFSEEESTISPDDCEFKVDLNYVIDSDYLIVTFFCIEGCGEKFKKMN